MAKLKATELAKRTALEGMQMMGGYGYATEYDMEAHVRHTLVTTIYGGASEIQREIIARLARSVTTLSKVTPGGRRAGRRASSCRHAPQKPCA